jgi:hypothetical protein
MPEKGRTLLDDSRNGNGKCYGDETGSHATNGLERDIEASESRVDEAFTVLSVLDDVE